MLRRLQGALLATALLNGIHLVGGDHRLDIQRFAKPNLRSLTQNSGLIFLGRVEKIEIPPPTRASGEPVRITFKVVDAIRGVRTGEVLVIREWRGLWPPGRDRYRRGETWVLFLHKPSRLGLTSPVGGDAGRIEVMPSQRLVLSPERSATLFPRSMRLQKPAAGLGTMRTTTDMTYAEFAGAIRELIADSGK